MVLPTVVLFLVASHPMIQLFLGAPLFHISSMLAMVQPFAGIIHPEECLSTTKLLAQCHKCYYLTQPMPENWEQHVTS
jgi:hypothetical protein